MKLKIQNGECDADIRVASNERYHHDDLEGECSKCHCPIFYRPEPPYLIPFICLKCAMPRLSADKKPTIVVSSNTLSFVKSQMFNA